MKEQTKQTKRANEQMSEESGQLIKEQKTAGHKEKTNYKIEIKQTKKIGEYRNKGNKMYENEPKKQTKKTMKCTTELQGKDRKNN